MRPGRAISLRTSADSVSERRRELLADWLTIAGAAGLFVSLFLTWSHQFSAPFLTVWGDSDQLRGVPRNPTGWQVYSSVDVMLALLAAGLVAVALVGTRAVRVGAIVLVGCGLAITLHALSAAPTDGANTLGSSFDLSGSGSGVPSAGVGETVAIARLAVALGGLVFSLTVD